MFNAVLIFYHDNGNDFSSLCRQGDLKKKKKKKKGKDFSFFIFRFYKIKA